VIEAVAIRCLIAVALAAAGPLVAAEPPGADHRGSNRLRFLVFGDSGTGEREQYTVGRHMAEECKTRGGCDFALMLGDNLYGRGLKPLRETDEGPLFDEKFRERFERPYEPLGTIDLWLVPGNHDWASARKIDTEIAYSRHSSRWRMPARDFAVPWLPDWIRIYGLDTTALARGRNVEQLERAHDHLCAGEGWRLLFGHHPVYTSGRHARADGSYPKARDALLGPLIESCGVQLYFAGHDHHQEHLRAFAFDQIVQGAAAKLRKVHTVKRRADDVEQLAAESLFGFAIVDVTPQRLELRFFGYGDGRPYAEWYCRVFERSEFSEPESRSTPCVP
jgi:hypothetical protein